MGDNIARSTFIGSGGSRFVNQTASDIYFQDYFNSNPPRQRISHTCTAWGVSLVYVEQQVADNGPFNYFALSEGLIAVQNHNQAPEGPPAGALPHIPAAGIANYNVNAVQVTGHRVLWNHRVDVRRTGAIHDMHYHEHEKRQGHGPIPPVIKLEEERKHYIFGILTYGSHVQNYREIRPWVP
jgi:hypothetical protein